MLQIAARQPALDQEGLVLVLRRLVLGRVVTMMKGFTGPL